MSIRSDAYQMCKKVWTAPSCDRIRQIITDIDTVTEQKMQTGKSRASFGVVARFLRAQILGYLIVDRDKERLSRDYSPLKWSAGLSQNETRDLASAYISFADLNYACIEHFLSRFPEFSLAIDHYKRFGYEIQDDVASMVLLDSDDIEQMARSFRDHRAFEMAERSYSRIQKQLPEDTEEYIFKAVIGLEKQLFDAGPLTTPRQIADLVFRTHPDSESRAMIRFLSALLSIRGSLEILDELKFQAIMTNKLPTLSKYSKGL